MSKIKPFLIIQLRPETEVADNEFEAFLRFGKLESNEVERIRAEINGLPEIDLNKYSGIIVGGSPFDITTPEKEKPEIQKKIESDFNLLLDEVVKIDFPFIGACSGIGILGNYCGIKISKKYGENIGGRDLHLTNVGKKDALLKGLPKTFRVLAGHKEACDSLPKNATLLGSTETCPVHMFKIKENIYATQFHPELTVPDIILRINAYKNSGYFNPVELKKVIDNVKDEVITEPYKILENFTKKYKKQIF